MTASSKLRRICKVINAASLLDLWPLESTFKLKAGFILRTHKRAWLYIVSYAAYIALHIIRYRDHLGLSRPQSRTSQASRRLEPPPRARSRPMVPRRRIFRRSRSGASQIRDAAPGAHRGRREERDGCPIRCIATDLLPSGGGLRPSGLEWTVAQNSRSQRSAQAHWRGHEVHRWQAGHRASTRCPGTGSPDQGRTRYFRPPPQHRTRLSAEKKTVATTNGVPAAAVSVYEKLRADVLCGQARPDGLGAVVYHGMLDGLAVLMSVTAPHTSSHSPTAVIPGIRGDRTFLRLMANMILQTQSEVKHVY
jgi:hypothetical protein